MIVFILLQVSTGDTMHHDAGDGLESGSLYLELQVLASHFTAGPGVLILRCTSHVAALYMQSAEVSIGFPARDPIPARGNASLYYYRALLY